MALFHKVESGFITIGHHRVERKYYFCVWTKSCEFFLPREKKMLNFEIFSSLSRFLSLFAITTKKLQNSVWRISKRKSCCEELFARCWQVPEVPSMRRRSCAAGARSPPEVTSSAAARRSRGRKRAEASCSQASKPEIRGQTIVYVVTGPGC